jgi:LmbE family N-acetylglucosaminyl deacetylase
MARVMAISAHPDDSEWGCGGTLAKHADKGDAVSIVVLTQGEAGTELAEIREREAHEAAEIIGASCSVGELPDTKLAEKAAIDLIENAVALNGLPDVAYIHSRSDTHQDHRAAAYAASVALRGVPHLYSYQTPSATEAFSPARISLITEDQLETKLAMLSRHKSQACHRWYMQPDYVRSAAVYWARSAGGYAEGLEVIRDVA